MQHLIRCWQMTVQSPRYPTPWFEGKLPAYPVYLITVADPGGDTGVEPPPPSGFNFNRKKWENMQFRWFLARFWVCLSKKNRLRRHFMVKYFNNLRNLLIFAFGQKFYPLSGFNFTRKKWENMQFRWFLACFWVCLSKKNTCGAILWQLFQ